MEASKLYRLAGNQVGIRAEKKSQRGIIARRFLAQQKFEIPMIKLLSIKVKDGNQEYWL